MLCQYTTTSLRISAGMPSEPGVLPAERVLMTDRISSTLGAAAKLFWVCIYGRLSKVAWSILDCWFSTLLKCSAQRSKICFLSVNSVLPSEPMTGAVVLLVGPYTAFRAQ